MGSGFRRKGLIVFFQKTAPDSGTYDTMPPNAPGQKRRTPIRIAVIAGILAVLKSALAAPVRALAAGLLALFLVAACGGGGGSAAGTGTGPPDPPSDEREISLENRLMLGRALSLENDQLGRLPFGAPEASHNPAILDRNPFAASGAQRSAVAARENAPQRRALLFDAPTDSPLMTVAVWINADNIFTPEPFIRVLIFISESNLARIENRESQLQVVSQVVPVAEVEPPTEVDPGLPPIVTVPIVGGPPVESPITTVTVTTLVEESYSPSVVAGSPPSEVTVTTSLSAPYAPWGTEPDPNDPERRVFLQRDQYYYRKITTVPETVIIADEFNVVKEAVGSRVDGPPLLTIVAVSTVTTRFPPRVEVLARERWTFLDCVSETRRLVVVNGVCRDAGQCPDGQVLNEAGDACEPAPPCEDDAYVRVNRVCELKLLDCPDGRILNGDENTCDCPEGMVPFGPSECELDCPPGETLNPARDACESVCRLGQEYNPATDSCRYPPGFFRGPDCPAGTYSFYDDPSQDELDLNLYYVSGEGEDISCRWLRAGANPRVTLVTFYGNRRTPLHHAAERNRLKNAKSLIHSGAIVDAGADIGEPTPLALAALGGHDEMAAYLIGQGASVDSPPGTPSPLHWAAGGGHYDSAEVLLDNNARVNALNNFGQTPLDEATARNEVRIAALLRERGGLCYVERGPLCALVTPTVTVVIDFPSELYPRPLVVPGQSPGVATFTATISPPADVGRNGPTVTIGITAHLRERATVVPTFMTLTSRQVAGEGQQAGSSFVAPIVTVTTYDPPALAVEMEQVKIVSQCPSGTTLFTGGFCQPLEGEIPPDLRCRPGTLPNDGRPQPWLNEKLHDAAESSANPAEVCAWLRRGAEVDGRRLRHYRPRTTIDITTPLGSAAGGINGEKDRIAKRLVVAQILLTNGANVNGFADDPNNASPLHWAVVWDRPAIIEFLLDNGANVNQPGPWKWRQVGNTPASLAGTADILRILLDNGAGMDTNDFYGRTLLHHFIHRGRFHPDIVRLLIQRGANVNAVRSDGITPLHEFALSSGEDKGIYYDLYLTDRSDDFQVEAVSILVSAGAEINAQDSSGRTPLDIAISRKDLPSVYDNDVRISVLRAHGGKCDAEDSPLCVAPTPSIPIGSGASPVDSDEDAKRRLREKFAAAFDPGPAFGDAFGKGGKSGASLESRMRAMARSVGFRDGGEDDGFAVWSAENDFGKVWFSPSRRADFGFGAAGRGDVLLGTDSFRNPFAALAGNAMAGGGEWDFRGTGGLNGMGGMGGSARFSAFGDFRLSTGLDGDVRRWADWAVRGVGADDLLNKVRPLAALAQDGARVRGAMGEVRFGDDDGAGVGFQAGALGEADAVLAGTGDEGDGGEGGEGGLRGLRSRTAFAGLSGRTGEWFGWRFRGAAHWGRTSAESSGLLESGLLWSGSYSAGVERSGMFRMGDAFGFRLSQPLRVESGMFRLRGDGDRNGGVGGSVRSAVGRGGVVSCSAAGLGFVGGGMGFAVGGLASSRRSFGVVVSASGGAV